MLCKAALWWMRTVWWGNAKPHQEQGSFYFSAIIRGMKIPGIIYVMVSGSRFVDKVVKPARPGRTVPDKTYNTRPPARRLPWNFLIQKRYIQENSNVGCRLDERNRYSSMITSLQAARGTLIAGCEYLSGTWYYYCSAGGHSNTFLVVIRTKYTS